MKKIELLIENFWEAPRFFAGVRLRVRLYYLKKLNFFSRMAPLFSRLPARLIGSISTPGRIISGEGGQGFHRPVMEKLKVYVLYFSLLSI